MKTPGPKLRWLVLGTSLAATIVAALLVEDDPEPLPPPAKRRVAVLESGPGSATNVVAIERPSLEQPDRGIVADQPIPEGIDPFRNKSWFVAPPPPPAPKPTAPPLPFQYLGKIVEEDGTRIFLNHQGRHLVLRAGDVIGGVYAVEEIQPGRIVFIYLPLKERQVMATSAG